MSILGGISNSGNMKDAPLFHEFKKQASFFLKEKIKTARLALTDVTPAQLLAEEATNGNPGGPDARSLKMISRAAFEVDDYWRIVEILHKRLARFDRRNWRASYKALILLEHLLTHGPESVAQEFHTNRDEIREMESFQHVDEKGFNWGLNVRRKTERVLKLLEKGPLWKEERDRARKISRGIEGFGSFSYRTPSGQEILQESSNKAFDKCNSQFNEHGNRDDLFSVSNEDKTVEVKHEKPLYPTNPTTNDNSRISLKENMAPDGGVLLVELNDASSKCMTESKPLLDEQKPEPQINMPVEDHPFNDDEIQTTMSFLSTVDIPRAC
ncbi:ENTH/VHS family protein [Forsythia ovata]|uniref:ENTH/VHS family protein n=1 Tax=Forsythia ovata TaxID=205694 RepID=A0ABD1RHX5_9LAMI